VLRKEIKFWAVAEFVLCRPPVVHFSSRILRCLMRSWEAVLPRLQLVPEDGELTWNLSILQLYCLLKHGEEFSVQEYKRLRVWAQSQRVYTVADMYRDGAWLQEEEFAHRIRSARHINRPVFVEFHKFVTSFTGITFKPIARLEGWEWTGLQQVTLGWTLPTQKWRELIKPTELDQSHLNRRWSSALSSQDWTTFWKRLWKGTPKNKICNMETRANGYFTNIRGALWGVCSELCPICGLLPETTAHLFFECEEVKYRWIKAIRLLRASKISFGRVNSAFDVLACAVDMHQKNPALLVIVAELSWCAWVERNSQVFQGNHVRMPLQVVFRTCASKLEALEATTGDNQKLQVFKESRQFLLSCAQFMSTISTNI
jgi:hypothetical protein